ncbi:hypothetical protein [Hansschlegelia plantiphila]|uniref:hypothetical protein n=1 Tax=Hansschlegelia plantiphila TaxID=374655 RepID=UPI0022F277B8|nr:hypothetical protein [Hansschlegelia plantiphila]
MAQNGLEIGPRAELLTDYVGIEARIAAMEKETKSDDGKIRMAAHRAISVATAERRRLHARLFVGGRKPKPDPRAPAEAVEQAPGVELDELSWAFLNDAVGDVDEDQKWALFGLCWDDAWFAPSRRKTRDLWAEFGPAVLKRWIVDKPGTRPWCWWKYEAPEQRRRVGGTGTLRCEAHGGKPLVRMGLPEGWIMPNDLRWHPFVGRGFQGFDVDDPPTFESQAAFLERHGLLVAGERKRLKAADFVSEAIRAPLEKSFA